MDWFEWHQGYDGALAERVVLVQEQLDAALDACAAGPIRILSVCAGQAHDVVGSLRRFDRRSDVEAVLVELDERNVAAARARIAEAGLPMVTVVAGDAGITGSYAEAVPANVILLCGVFGSLTDEDIERTVASLPALAAPAAQVIWTAHRSAPGLADHAASCFDRYGFVSRWDGDDRFGVSRHQLTADPQPYAPGTRMFTFADEQTLIDIGRIQPPAD
jgi:hypothetical protein